MFREPLKSVTLFVFSFWLCGCTSVEIHNASSVETKWFIGFPVIEVTPGDQTTVIKSQSLGIVKSPNAFNVGYLNEIFMYSGKECELVLFEPRDKAIVGIKELYHEGLPLCINKEMDDEID